MKYEKYRVTDYNCVINLLKEFFWDFLLTTTKQPYCSMQQTDLFIQERCHTAFNNTKILRT